MRRLLLAFVLAASAPPSAAAESPSGPVRIPTEIPVRRGSDQAHPPGQGSPPLLLTLGLLVLAGGGLWALRRWRGRGVRPGAPWAPWFGRSGDEGALRVVQSRQLTPRTSVHVLRWGGKEWLVGCGDQQVTVLAQKSPATDDPPGAEQKAPENIRSTP